MNPTSIPSQQFYTVKEAAAILKISEDTLRRMMRRRQIAYTEITPRTRRISQKALDEFAKGSN
jgi:excisionase family DNA binding protein